MPSEQSSDVKFEIGHVLFIDIVDYSKLLITKENEHVETLRKIVRGTEQFLLAERKESSCGWPRLWRRACLSQHCGSGRSLCSGNCKSNEGPSGAPCSDGLADSYVFVPYLSIKAWKRGSLRNGSHIGSSLSIVTVRPFGTSSR